MYEIVHRNSLSAIHDLGFAPHSPWPFPGLGFCFNNFLISPGEQLCLQVHGSPTDFQKVFTALFPNLGLSELARFYRRAQHFPEIPLQEIFKHYRIHLNELSQETLNALWAQPDFFQDWVDFKKVSLQDLSPLLSAGSLHLEPVLQHIVSSNLSKSQGILGLELSIELLLLGRSLQELDLKPLSPARTADKWLENLKKLRFPYLTERDHQTKNSLQQLHWPQSSDPRWVRQGDKAGMELRLFVTQKVDLEKSLRSLQKVLSQMNSDQELPQ